MSKLTEAAKEHLDSDEKVLYSVMGSFERKILGSNHIRTGIFLATSTSLFFFSKKLTGFESESFPYQNIISFESSKGILGHKIRFFVSNNEVSMKYIQDGDIKGFT